MIGNKVFAPHTFYDNPLDKLFVWMVDDMEMSRWYDGASKWDLILQIYDANCYNSGVYLQLNDKKQFKKIGEELISKREFEIRKKQTHEKFIDSININDD